MSKARFESFSDAIFAFAMTLLVLEIHVPDFTTANDARMSVFLPTLIRPFVTFVISFFTIGIVWLNHHRTFAGVKSVDLNTVFLNLFLMLTVTFMPYPTELLGKFGPLPSLMALYSASAAATGIGFALVRIYVARKNPVADPARLYAGTLGGVVVCSIATGVSFVSPTVALILDAIVPTYFLLVNWLLLGNATADAEPVSAD